MCTIGFSVIDSTKELFACEIELLKGQIERNNQGRVYRRQRRSRLRHRKLRFDKQNKPEGWLPVFRISLIAISNLFTEAFQSLGGEMRPRETGRMPWPNADGSMKPDRHIEVKGRSKGQPTITVNRNEILYALNQADKFILAVVIVEGDGFEGPFYVRNPFCVEPDLGCRG